MIKKHEPSQKWNPSYYASNARFVSELGSGILKKLSACKGEKILDLGCGDGFLTQKIIEQGSKVIAIDSSPEFIEVAKKNGIDAHVINGHNIPYKNCFDAVFSNAALHWMLDPEAVIIGVSNALKSGGRFVAEFGGAGNVKKIINSIKDEFDSQGLIDIFAVPWYLPPLEEYKLKLESYNFLVREIELFDRPTKLPSDVGKWLDTFADPFFKDVDEKLKEEMKKNIIINLSKLICDDQGVWWADYVRLRFVADHF
ncbi:MAG: SAM-dependent methyltransferase [Rhodospirillaceae bacterium]|nr:SAM-dependent methyltransferase [Rhodospirillaceae bacterium]|tara:strand:- start:520 stop:1284 length:765 start_codon:yes stop_codon:yes gene_type:complete